MYFTNTNNFFHGIMFHHFHGLKDHLSGQGSISKDDFFKIIKFIGKKNIVNADEFLIKFRENKLSDKDVCLTFDDNLKCQYDIALPVIEDMKIKSFFFSSSSRFTGNLDLLEVFRYFRLKYFNSIDEFCNDFLKILSSYKNKNLDKFFQSNKTTIDIWKKKFPFYSLKDIQFRLARDFFLLNREDYYELMLTMFKEKNFKYQSIINKLLMSENDLKKIHKLGHIVGLHSHSHPARLENLTYKEQYNEYQSNKKILSKILGIEKISSMSHPAGSYNDHTLRILEKLNVEIGFKQVMALEGKMKKINNSKFEIARQDHANIIKMITK